LLWGLLHAPKGLESVKKKKDLRNNTYERKGWYIDKKKGKRDIVHAAFRKKPPAGLLKKLTRERKELTDYWSRRGGGILKKGNVRNLLEKGASLAFFAAGNLPNSHGLAKTSEWEEKGRKSRRRVLDRKKKGPPT